MRLMIILHVYECERKIQSIKVITASDGCVTMVTKIVFPEVREL